MLFTAATGFYDWNEFGVWVVSRVLSSQGVDRGIVVLCFWSPLPSTEFCSAKQAWDFACGGTHVVPPESRPGLSKGRARARKSMEFQTRILTAARCSRVGQQSRCRSDKCLRE